MRIVKSFNKGDMIYLGTEYYQGNDDGIKEFSYFIKGGIYIIIINNRFVNSYNMSNGVNITNSENYNHLLEFLRSKKKIVSVPIISKTHDTVNYLLNHIVLKMMIEL